MNIYAISYFVLLFPSLASAAEQKDVTTHGQKSVDDIVQLEFSKDFCRKVIIEHRPRKEVMYQAGVDVDGQPVVPADLNAFTVPVPTKIVIPITIHKEYKTLGTGDLVPRGLLKSPYVHEIPLGFVEYELKSGKMTYNGKTFSSQQQALLRQKCQDVLEKSEN